MGALQDPGKFTHGKTWKEREEDSEHPSVPAATYANHQRWKDMREKKIGTQLACLIMFKRKWVMHD